MLKSHWSPLWKNILDSCISNEQPSKCFSVFWPQYSPYEYNTMAKMKEQMGFIKEYLKQRSNKIISNQNLVGMNRFWVDLSSLIFVTDDSNQTSRIQNIKSTKMYPWKVRNLPRNKQNTDNEETRTHESMALNTHTCTVKIILGIYSEWVSAERYTQVTQGRRFSSILLLFFNRWSSCFRSYLTNQTQMWQKYFIY